MRIADYPRSCWVATNLLGIGLFLSIASQFWTEPRLANVPGVNLAAAFGWFVYAMPVAALFVFANLQVGVWHLLRFRWVSLAITMLLLAAWIVAWLFDNSHHGI